MPSFRQFFPPKVVRGEDFAAAFGNQAQVVTIDRVWPAEPYQNQTTGEVQVSLMCKFVEFNKPIRMGIEKCSAIEAILGTDDYDRWSGGKILITPLFEKVYDKMQWTMKVAPVPAGAAVTLQPNTDVRMLAETKRQALPPGRVVATEAARPALDTRPIGEINAGKMLEAIKAAGGSWDRFLLYAKINDVAAYEQVHGSAMADVPRFVATGTVKAYIESLKQDEDDIPF